MPGKDDVKSKILLKNFYENGFTAAKTVDDLRMLNEILHDEPLIDYQTYINLFINQTKIVAQQNQAFTAQQQAQQKAMEELEERLNTLQYKLTEVTTHHWTNKRKRQIRGIVPEMFPELKVKKVTLAEVNKLERLAKAAQEKKQKKKAGGG
jgi:hypothetical protein